MLVLRSDYTFTAWHKNVRVSVKKEERIRPGKNLMIYSLDLHMVQEPETPFLQSRHDQGRYNSQQMTKKLLLHVCRRTEGITTKEAVRWPLMKPGMAD